VALCRGWKRGAMFCPSCGRETPGAAQFCTACGASLGPPAAASPLAGQPLVPPSAAISFGGQRFAGFWVRFLAYFIDRIILMVGSLILVLPAILVFGLPAVGRARMLGHIAGASTVFLLLPLGLLLNWLYEAGFLSSLRQATPGKMALSLVVTDLAGGRISFGRATGRFFGRYLSSMTLLIGYLIQPFTERRQALHDLVAGTLVLRR
jgi:uncharacterized RDD family membrane protein YckC